MDNYTEHPLDVIPETAYEQIKHLRISESEIADLWNVYAEEHDERQMKIVHNDPESCVELGFNESDWEDAVEQGYIDEDDEWLSAPRFQLRSYFLSLDALGEDDLCRLNDYLPGMDKDYLQDNFGLDLSYYDKMLQIQLQFGPSSRCTKAVEHYLQMNNLTTADLFGEPVVRDEFATQLKHNEKAMDKVCDWLYSMPDSELVESLDLEMDPAAMTLKTPTVLAELTGHCQDNPQVEQTVKEVLTIRKSNGR